MQPARSCTDGFAFLEFVDAQPERLRALFLRMGFRSRHAGARSDVSVLQQGEACFVINHARTRFLEEHGPSVRGIGILVWEPRQCAEKSLTAGAGRYQAREDGSSLIDVPTVRGIGDSLIYFVDAAAPDAALRALAPEVDLNAPGAGLTAIDHTSHIVRPASFDQWATFYSQALGFSQRQYLDVRGAATGMQARSMVSACGKVRIPIAASANDDPGTLNQNDEFIRDYGGEGIQHIALATSDIFKTVDSLRSAGIEFMTPPPDGYYKNIVRRIPDCPYPIDELQRRGILLDGISGDSHLLQIFTKRQIGPVFFEIIQRHNHSGFGEGNFRALFESQERDQQQRRLGLSEKLS